MRRFRFIGDPKDYETNEPPFLVSRIYQGDFIGEGCMSSVEEYATRPWSSNAWQEVFDEPKPLHKDTDLGLFSAMILSEIGNNPNYKLVPKIKLVSESIELAKELIKQLNEENK